VWFFYVLLDIIFQQDRSLQIMFLCWIFQKLMWKLNKSIAKEMLPTQPVDFPVEPWWGVFLVNFTLEEFKVRFAIFLVLWYINVLLIHNMMRLVLNEKRWKPGFLFTYVNLFFLWSLQWSFMKSFDNSLCYWFNVESFRRRDSNNRQNM